MPDVGERRTKGDETREWTGTAWRLVRPDQPAASTPPGGPRLLEEPGRYATELLSNAPGSFGRNVWGLVTAPYTIGKLAYQGATGQLPPGLLASLPGAVAEDYAKAYGGLENAETTLREDPFRVLSDLATVAGGVSGAARLTGAAGRAAGRTVPGIIDKTARAATATERALNPLTPVAAVARRTGEGVGDLASAAIIRPPKALREEVDATGKAIGQHGVAEAIRREKVFRSVGAETQADRVTARTLTPQLARTPDVPAVGIVRDISRAPQRARLQVREKLGEANQVAPYREKLMRFWTEAQSRPGARFPAPELNTLKQEAQDLAYEAGRQVDTPAQMFSQAQAQAIRRGLETANPELAATNQQLQRLIWAKRALGEAEQRPLSTFVSPASALITGSVTGNPLAGLGVVAGYEALRSPKVAASLIIGSDLAGQGVGAVGHPAFRVPALWAAPGARATEAEEQKREQEALRQQLAEELLRR
jgi:hypothetical protein